MSIKRRDNKKRILHTGETQRKDGRYAYTYKDVKGKRRTVYSWRLVSTDKTPEGKKDDFSLREKEKQIQKEVESGIGGGENMTVAELAGRYLLTRNGLRQNTVSCYKAVIKRLCEEEFGKKDIGGIKKTDAKVFLIKLQREGGLAYSTVKTFKNVLNPAFRMAVDDDIILKNPFDFKLSEVLDNDGKQRRAISKRWEDELLKFVERDKHFSQYYDSIFLMLKTGLRVSEFAGLTISDIDFENRRINVDHQLLKDGDGYVTAPPKTRAAIRTIPMSDEVYTCLRRMVKNRGRLKEEPVVDGKYGFLYITPGGKLTSAGDWGGYFRNIRAKYNRVHGEKMPAISPHICRHTLCSNMAKEGMNPKILQYIMGHDDIATTYNVYVHAKTEDARSEMVRIGKIKEDR